MEKDTAGVQAEVMKTLAGVTTEETKCEKDLRGNLNLFFSVPAPLRSETNPIN